ncbi:MAG: 3-methyl-2-oxobutanoate dehydrogenase subunit VorB [Bacillota bacterium]|nr:3-methyl-2-oxobutanoate dehydrogenase subunit VorB [Bacillota bacterium]
MKGNEAIAEAAIQAGCRYFFGYPITPQNELPEYMARRLPEVGGVYLQAESEVSAINMVYGAAGAGGRVMTSSSSPGISLMQEGISYLAGAELPCVLVNIVRGGPGLGGIHAAQSDYFQATKGGGHGDYRLLVLAPGSVQETVDLLQEAFDLADKYRNPVMLLGDAVLGQMMEAVRLPRDLDEPLPPPPPPESKVWATTGAVNRSRNVINSLYIEPERLEKHNWHIQEKYRRMEAEEVRYEAVQVDDAGTVVVAYGTTARIARTAVDEARRQGLKAGLFRPISLYPFPYQALREAAGRARRVLVVEMSCGQMLDDVRLAVGERCPVEFYGRPGGNIPTPQEVLDRIAGKGGEAK